MTLTFSLALLQLLFPSYALSLSRLRRQLAMLVFDKLVPLACQGQHSPKGAFHKTHPASIPCLLLLTGNSLF